MRTDLRWHGSGRAIADAHGDDLLQEEIMRGAAFLICACLPETQAARLLERRGRITSQERRDAWEENRKRQQPMRDLAFSGGCFLAGGALGGLALGSIVLQRCLVLLRSLFGGLPRHGLARRPKDIR